MSYPRTPTTTTSAATTTPNATPNEPYDASPGTPTAWATPSASTPSKPHRITHRCPLTAIFDAEVLWTLCNRRPEGPNRPLTCGDRRGPGRARTDDSRGVNAVLYQLSYRPVAATAAVHKSLRSATRTAASLRCDSRRSHASVTVSYTHLTLPT